MKKCKKLLPGEYHTHWNLRSYQDIIQDHVNFEQELGGFTENATMSKVERNLCYQEIGREYMTNKTP